MTNEVENENSIENLSLFEKITDDTSSKPKIFDTDSAVLKKPFNSYTSGKNSSSQNDQINDQRTKKHSGISKTIGIII